MTAFPYSIGEAPSFSALHHGGLAGADGLVPLGLGDGVVGGGVVPVGVDEGVLLGEPDGVGDPPGTPGMSGAFAPCPRCGTANGFFALAPGCDPPSPTRPPMTSTTTAAAAAPAR